MFSNCLQVIYCCLVFWKLLEWSLPWIMDFVCGTVDFLTDEPWPGCYFILWRIGTWSWMLLLRVTQTNLSSTSSVFSTYPHKDSLTFSYSRWTFSNMLYQGQAILQMYVKESCASFGHMAKFKSYSYHPDIGKWHWGYYNCTIAMTSAKARATRTCLSTRGIFIHIYRRRALCTKELGEVHHGCCSLHPPLPTFTTCTVLLLPVFAPPVKYSPEFSLTLLLLVFLP